MKNVTRRGAIAALVLVSGWCVASAQGQDVRYEERNGVRYQVTTRVQQRQVPVTTMQNQQQTVYAQQLQTNTMSHQQLYAVPKTSYQWNSRLHGRWNPFVTPYWTYNLRPVTTWSTQVANVQIPVNQVAWVPQTKTVQVPVTAYRTVEEKVETTMAMNDVPSTNTSLANARPLSRPSATIATRPSTSLGGVALQNDPPRQATGGGWQSPTPGTTGSRY